MWAGPVIRSTPCARHLHDPRRAVKASVGTRAYTHDTLGSNESARAMIEATQRGGDDGSDKGKGKMIFSCGYGYL